jgi:hypothetical protein
MSWLAVNTGGRKFLCIDCDGPGALKSSEALNLRSGALEPLKLFERLEGYVQKAREDLEKLPPGEKHEALGEMILELQRAIDFIDFNRH